MNKQPLKVLAFVAALAIGLTVSTVQASEVSDVLKAGAVKVQIAKTAQTKVDRIDQIPQLQEPGQHSLQPPSGPTDQHHA